MKELRRVKMTKDDVVSGYMLNEKHVIAEMLYDTITKYEELLKPKNCVDCRHYGVDNGIYKYCSQNDNDRVPCFRWYDEDLFEPILLNL